MTIHICPTCGETQRLRYPGDDPENGPAEWLCSREHQQEPRFIPFTRDWFDFHRYNLYAETGRDIPSRFRLIIDMVFIAPFRNLYNEYFDTGCEMNFETCGHFTRKDVIEAMINARLYRLRNFLRRVIGRKAA